MTKIMPLIDLHCHLGAIPGAMSVRPPDLAQASAYAQSVGVEAMGFAATEASTDLRNGNAHLAQAIESDARFFGWLTLSVHQPALSQELARQYLMRTKWIGARFECPTDFDAVDAAGGHEVLNALRRYGRPVLMTVATPHTLAAALAAAQEFSTLRFLISPQDENLTADSLPEMKEYLNVSLVPVAAFCERDLLHEATISLGERGERRVLWASDWGRFHPTAALGMLKDSAISPAQRERIALRNARELLAR